MSSCRVVGGGGSGGESVSRNGLSKGEIQPRRAAIALMRVSKDKREACGISLRVSSSSVGALGDLESGYSGFEVGGRAVREALAGRGVFGGATAGEVGGTWLKEAASEDMVSN
jgi:hypothetical protein